VNLPQGPLHLDDRLRFLYPVPAEGELLEALSSCGLETPLILAIARNESLFDPAARSRAGALGWLQIMPFHWPDQGYRAGSILWSDPVASLDLGVRLLRECAGRFAGDPYRSVAAYNAGSGAVARWESQLGEPQPQPVFLAWIGYPETQRYVEKVLRDREIYDWIIGDQEP
jgi:soluble lytic murein transglycosylase